ncbi:glycosyltransferase [Granulicella cerasi]|uniref:Glycosyltransferase n=2 Tax=Granulicella cerasi TaxID=741063 RepID=A0ABW1ZC99_9BACT
MIRGWKGKQHACWKLAREAIHAPLLLFLDADVRVHPWAIARAVAALRRWDVSLLSGFLRTEYEGFLDALLLPLMQFFLLTYMPLRKMQESTDERYSVASSKLMLVERGAYFASGGHAAIRGVADDGVLLARVFREHGYFTDVVDLTKLASVHLRRSPGATWASLSRRIADTFEMSGKPFWVTTLLKLAQLAPAVVLGWLLYAAIVDFSDLLHGSKNLDIDTMFFGGLLMAIAIICALVPRLWAAYRFKQPWWSAVMHPLGVAVLLVLEGSVWLRTKLFRPSPRATRSYAE